MTRHWSTHEVRDLIAGRAVSYTDLTRSPVPVPPSLVGIRTETGGWGWTNLSTVHPSDRNRVIKAFGAAAGAPGELTEVTVCFRSATGWLQQRVTFLNLLDHIDFVAFLTMVDNAEELEEDPTERAARMIDPTLTPWARLQIDDTATISAVDGMIEAIYGRGADSLVGRNALELVHPDDIPRCIDAGLRASADPGVTVTVTHRTLRPDGSCSTVESNMQATGGPDGGWTLHLRDAVQGMRSDLRRALDGDQFVLHYQPMLDLHTGIVVGAEALLRWQHPRRGLVPPAEFIPGAEETGIIVDLGAWVVRTACAEAATWPEHLHVAVNLSVRQLADDAIVRTVAGALASSGLAPERLVLEVTESAVMENAQMALDDLNSLKKLGVRLAIDDFGTGYSSLLYLKRMPVDVIKIDRSFVDRLDEDPENHAIVTTVVSLAQAFGIESVAEGVETLGQHDALTMLGCDSAQGFLWSRPVPADQFRAFALDGERNDGDERNASAEHSH